MNSELDDMTVLEGYFGSACGQTLYFYDGTTGKELLVDVSGEVGDRHSVSSKWYCKWVRLTIDLEGKVVKIEQRSPMTRELSSSKSVSVLTTTAPDGTPWTKKKVDNATLIIDSGTDVPSLSLELGEVADE